MEYRSSCARASAYVLKRDTVTKCIYRESKLFRYSALFEECLTAQSVPRQLLCIDHDWQLFSGSTDRAVTTRFPRHFLKSASATAPSFWSLAGDAAMRKVPEIHSQITSRFDCRRITFDMKAESLCTRPWSSHPHLGRALQSRGIRAVSGFLSLDTHSKWQELTSQRLTPRFRSLRFAYSGVIAYI